MRLDFFGGPTLLDPEGAEVALTPAHQRLLALVWGHGKRGLPRGEAIWMLWEAEDDTRSRHRLRQALHDLAGRTGRRLVEADGDDRLVPGEGVAVRSDLSDFVGAIEAGELRRALGIYRDGFVPLLAPRGMTEAYEDWLTAKRESLRRKLRDAAAWQWDRYHPLGAWEESAEAAEVLYALDPDSEVAATRVIEARAMTGNLEAAEGAAADLLATLPDGEGLERETVELIERVRRFESLAGAGPSPRTPKAPPLVGRRAALATARGMVGRVGEGGFEFLLLTGEGGAGKTRFMEEIWKETNLAGYRCLRARPVELERSIPLNPLVDMVGDPSVVRFMREMEEPWRSVVATLLPVLPEGMDPPVVPPISESSLSRRLYDAFATLFTAVAAEKPLFLFIDDLHWADATSVAVLQFVQRRWSGGGLGIVAALRPELVAQGDGAARYLDTSVEDLPTTRIELGDLSESEAATLVRHAAETDLDDDTTARLCAFAGRNPFYLIELTRDYVAGEVKLPELPTDAITLPISLKQLLEPRVARISGKTAEVASYLAAWGRQATFRELAGLLGLDLAQIGSACEELELSRLAVVERGRIRLAHELFRAAIYQVLSATRRSLIHQRIASFLLGLDSPPIGELALHCDKAGDSPAAAQFARRAADRALENGAIAEAALFLRLVVENESREVERAEATGDLARVLHMNREIMRADPLLELAAARLRSVGLHGRALRLDIRRIEGLAELGATPISELRDRLATIKHAASRLEDYEVVARAIDSELHLLHRVGLISEIRDLMQEARALTASSSTDAACLANASLALGVLFGEPDEATACANEAVRLAELSTGSEHLPLAYSRLVVVLTLKGELQEQEGVGAVERAWAHARSRGDLTLKAYILNNQGVAAMECGQHDAAETHFEAAAGLLSKSDPGLPHVTVWANQGELALRRRAFSEAASIFERAIQFSGGSTPLSLQKTLQAGQGIAALETGRLSLVRGIEENLHLGDGIWYFDPTLLFDLKARLLLRRGRAATLIVEVESAASELRRCLPLAWVKLRLLSAKLRKRSRLEAPPDVADVLDTAARLGVSQYPF